MRGGWGVKERLPLWVLRLWIGFVGNWVGDGIDGYVQC